MTDSVASPQSAPAAMPPRDAAAVLPAVRSGARWFWWIVGLSIVNIAMFQAGNNTSFVMGLGITAVSDGLFVNHKVVGFVVDAIALGFFAFVGLQAQRGRLWAFYSGIAVYALDALIYAAVQEWTPVAFHCLAIYFIGKGTMALRNALKAADKVETLLTPH